MFPRKPKPRPIAPFRAPDTITVIFDRTKPAYRLFDMSEEPGGRMLVWCEVGVDNTPGAEVNPEMAEDLFAYIAVQPWKHLFYAAFRKNKKATIYHPVDLPQKS